MELYKWHKGTELPTEECDCVVVHTPIETDDYSSVLEIATVGMIQIFNDSFIMINSFDEEIPQEYIVIWMPIKFPEEVS